MRFFTAASILPILVATASAASTLSTTNVATVLAGAFDQSALTVPVDAMAAITKLGTGGTNASTLSSTDTAAIDTCVTDAQNNNTASKAGLGGGTGSAGNIVFVAAKVTLHACETAQQQISVAGGGTASDSTVDLLVSNVGVLNANTKAAAAKRATKFRA